MVRKRSYETTVISGIPFIHFKAMYGAKRCMSAILLLIVVYMKVPQNGTKQRIAVEPNVFADNVFNCFVIRIVSFVADTCFKVCNDSSITRPRTAKIKSL